MGALCAVCIVWSSCSIKEERSGCPCLLAVNFTALPTGRVEYSIEDTDGELLQRGTIHNSDTTLFLPVPRSGVRLTAVSGIGLSPDGIHIPYGSPCPAAYLYRSIIGTDHESVMVTPTLHKHFCNLNLILDGPPGDGVPLDVRVHGSVDGIGYDGRPLAGEFTCSAVSGPCRLPRQAASDNLMLDIVLADNVVRTFALGTYMRNAGYDWAEPDLADISLELSLSVTTLRLIADDWSVTVPLNVEI